MVPALVTISRVWFSSVCAGITAAPEAADVAMTMLAASPEASPTTPVAALNETVGLTPFRVMLETVMPSLAVTFTENFDSLCSNSSSTAADVFSCPVFEANIRSLAW